MTFLASPDMLVLQGRLKAGDWLLVKDVSSGVAVAAQQLGRRSLRSNCQRTSVRPWTVISR